MVAGRARVALADPLFAPPRLAASGDFFFLSVVLGDLVVGLGLDQPGLEDHGEPQAWELGHGRSGRRGWAGSPPPRRFTLLTAAPWQVRWAVSTPGRISSAALLLLCLRRMAAFIVGPLGLPDLLFL